MKISKILEQAETLDHHERWRYMIDLGQKARHDNALAYALENLAHSSVHYERLLALMSLQGSHDQTLIAGFLCDPSSLYMSCILKLAAQYLDDDQLLQAFPTLPRQKRVGLFRTLILVKREKLNDKLYKTLSSQEQHKLLPYTSEAFVQSQLNLDNLPSLSVSEWRALAERFPSIVLALLQQQFEKSRELSWSFQNGIHRVLQAMSKNWPSLGLVLLKQVSEFMPVQGYYLKHYLCQFPKDVVNILIKTPSIKIPIPASVLKRLDDEQMLFLLSQTDAASSIATHFPQLHPQQRAMLYNRNAESWRTQTGAIPVDYLKALPQNIRQKEALHGFNVPLLAALPLVRVGYLSVLPFEEALPLAKDFLSQPEGELRAKAVSTLVKCGRYDEAALEAILDFCLARKNEQDPVRLAMMQALASLPPTRWREGHLPKLKAVIHDALKARDSSSQTLSAAIQLLLNMVVYQMKFVVSELPALAERVGYINAVSLESRITDHEMPVLALHLMPLLTIWMKRGLFHLVVTLIEGFGRRVKAAPQWIALLIEITEDKRGNIASLGLDALVNLELKKELSKLIPQMIEKDNSWVQEPTVADYLDTHKQSLLTPFLTPQIYRGRFSSGKTKIMLRFENHFIRWSANQQKLYAQSNLSIVGGKHRSAWELYICVRRLSAMPSIDIQPVAELASLQTKDTALRDKALEALGRVDAGRGIPFLLPALEDERARVAIYALRQALLNMPVPQALGLLNSIKTSKVTVQKEILRLAGDLQGPDAYAFLNQYAARDDLHPDLYIALLRAYWNYLDHDDVWERFYQAAQNPRAALARSTIAIPQEGLNKRVQLHLAHHMTLLLQHPDEQIRQETLMRLVTMPLGPVGQLLQAALKGQLEGKTTYICQLAAKALLFNTGEDQYEALVPYFAELQQAKALIAVVEAYIYKSTNMPRISQHLQNSALALAQALIKRRWQIVQAVRLVLCTQTPGQIGKFLVQIEDLGLLNPDALHMANDSWGSVLRWNRFSIEIFEQLEVTLHETENSNLSRTGLALLEAIASKVGWQPSYLPRLVKYQQDANAWIRDEAELIEPPPTI